MPITTRMHGILDYTVAILAIVISLYFLYFGAPEAAAPVVGETGAPDQGRVAAWAMIVAGVLVIGLSLLTRYEFSAIEAIPMSVHIAIDVLFGLALIASPFALGFSDVIWWPHVLVGTVALGTALLTDRSSTRYDASLDTVAHTHA